MTMGGTASNLLGLLLARDRAGENVRAQRPAAERVADRGERGRARQHPALGGAARARDRGGDRAPHRRAARSRRRLDEALEGHEHVIAIVGTAGTTDLGAIDPLDALADRGAQAQCAGSTSTPPSAPGLTLSDARTGPAEGHRTGRLGDRRPAQAVVDAVRGERAARAGRRRAAGRPPRERLPQPARGRGRGPAEPRRSQPGHLTALRRAEGARRAEGDRSRSGSRRWSTTCSTSRSTPAEAIDQHPHFELVARPQTVMVAFRHTTADNIAHPPRPVRLRSGRDRPHDRRRPSCSSSRC